MMLVTLLLMTAAVEGKAGEECQRLQWRDCYKDYEDLVSVSMRLLPADHTAIASIISNRVLP